MHYFGFVPKIDGKCGQHRILSISDIKNIYYLSKIFIISECLRAHPRLPRHGGLRPRHLLQRGQHPGADPQGGYTILRDSDSD